ncbi:MAG: leucine-rich repeat domain-containing protein [Oscillospiraceae bacterium]|nr:leucine-rich repeat domain-containing protein [Oscillospiraceae bacterium]
MKRRMILYILALSILASLALPAAATEVATEVVREPGYCGEDMTWSFEDGTLTIAGAGEMDDYEDGTEPWRAHKGEITRLVLNGGVTYIGAYAFKDYDALEAVDFGQDLYEIGPFAFSSCDGLTAITLPASFKIFGERSFQSCKNLTIFHCEGKFPSFRDSCLWDTYGTIYYPADRPWKVDTIAKLEEAFKGRIEFLASDGTDHYIPTEPTEEVTEPETVPETTVPETEPETEPVTEPTEIATEPVVQTEAPTEAPMEPETQATEPATEPVEKEERYTGGGIFFGLIIIMVVLTLVLTGALIFKGKKGRYSR